MKNRYFLEIAFNGTHYHGWQLQPNNITVQSVMNDRISVLLGEKINCLGCGRTDSGVHAEKFMLHFDTQKILDLPFAEKLDRFLPVDIKVRNIYANKDKIHARFDAMERTYRYVISKGKNPFSINQATVSHVDLQLDLLRQAAMIVTENNDFESFSKSHNSHNHYLCNIIHADWQEDDDFYTFRITANRFVRSMIRMMVGTMVNVGRGRISPEDFGKIIESKNRKNAGKVFPAHGLYFCDVKYPEGKLLLIGT